ncbi:MAG: hypothetical protein QN182_08010 [Armatimonadota bacterium]|nr:hypothetical protein [Armatimonadota bacterium]
MEIALVARFVLRLQQAYREWQVSQVLGRGSIGVVEHRLAARRSPQYV